MINRERFGSRLGMMLAMLGIGPQIRRGPIRAFMQMMGPKWAWMGAFYVFGTVATMFYYSVVAGSTLRYTIASITGEVPQASSGAFWKTFTSSHWPVLTCGVMIGLATLVVARGVRTIEKLTLVLTARALLLSGTSAGLSYMFTVDCSSLAHAGIWIEALT